MSTQYIQSPFNKQRKDKFLLVMNLPEPMKILNKKLTRNNQTVLFDSIQFSVNSCNVPRVAIDEHAARYSGQTLHVSTQSRPPYPNVKVEFTIDNYYNNYWVIYSWLSLINEQKVGTLDFKNLVDFTNPDVYKSTFTLYGLDEFNNKIIQFDFTKAFPVLLGEINYSYRDAAQIDTNFEFAFDQLITRLLEPQPAT
jgi:hypothetical protein